MKNKLFYMLIFMVTTLNSSTVLSAEAPNAAEIIVCQDQAENYGNGKGEDIIETKCLNSFKTLASQKTIAEFPKENLKFFGYKNMIIVERTKDNIISTEIIAGNSTEIKSIIAIKVDEKNKEIVVLDESGEVYFFTTTLTGNIAPYRILKHKDLQGANEIAIDSLNDQIAIYNKRDENILFFSRLANINAPAEKQKLEILKVINTLNLNFSELSIDSIKGEVHGIDLTTKQKINLRIF